jgi:hypothetical protein
MQRSSVTSTLSTNHPLLDRKLLMLAVVTLGPNELNPNEMVGIA